MMMNMPRPSPAFGSKRSLQGLFLAIWMFFSAVAFAQAPAASGDAAPAIPAAELDGLVGPIALYPDDLIGIILPGSTYPLEIVQADRYLEKKKTDKDLPVNETWHDSVKSLLNYPDVVKKMSTELDWTSDLGEAVVTDQGAVLEAIQRFRRQVQAAGNLKSDDKQTVIVEQEIIQVVQANPEVIYVPQYNPTTIVVAGGYPTYGYYPAPYPVYYYPYPPGAAFATGLIWGAAIGAAWNGGRYGCDYHGGDVNVDINRNTNINSNRTANRQSQGTAWKSDKKPGQVSGQTGRRTNSARVGDTAGGRGANNMSRDGTRPSNQTASRPSAGTNDRASGQAGDRGAQNRGGANDRSSGQAQNRGGDAFGSYGSGRDTRADSSRGASSRQSMSSSGGGRSAASSGRSGGGGARKPAGGGGRSGGGGGRR